MTAVVCEQEDEEVGLTEKEMRDEAAVTPGWVEVSKLKGSTRLSLRLASSWLTLFSGLWNISSKIFTGVALLKSKF